MVDFISKKLEIELDDWQKKYIKAEGNTAVRAGRQSGKSFAQAIKTAIFALLQPKKENIQTILITGGVERQAYELYMKTRTIIEQIAPHMIKGRPTMQKIELTNKIRILSLPAGRDGSGLRNYALIKLVVDEAAYVHDDVYLAIEPMLATTNGTMDLLSTPRGNIGVFWDAFQEGSGFETFWTTSEECPRISKEFLNMQKRKLTKMQYAQEYLAEFSSSLSVYFEWKTIEKNLSKEKILKEIKGIKILGVDIARYGGDENAFVVIEIYKGKVRVLHIETTERISTVETKKKIEELEKEYNFKKIYIDDGGIGGAVLDFLLTVPKIRRKIEGLNNAQRSILYGKSKGKHILKEDLYGNCQRLFQQKLIDIPNNTELLESLSSIQFEYTEHGNLKIWGKYSHITEALIRACWGVITYKHLNIWIY